MLIPTAFVTVLTESWCKHGAYGDQERDARSGQGDRHNTTLATSRCDGQGYPSPVVC